MKPMRAAFTLLELLVVIGVLAVVLSVLLPAIGGAKESARLRAIEARQRDGFLVLSAFMADHRDEFPFYGVERSLEAQYSFNGFHSPAAYQSQCHWWAAYITDLGYDATAVADRIGPREGESSNPSRPRYAYSTYSWLTFAAYAEPSYFGEIAGQSIDKHLVQRSTTVRHPARKGLLVRENWGQRPEDYDLPGSLRIIMLADGHTETRRLDSLTPGVVLFYVPTWDKPVIATPDGLLGRDF